MVRKALIGVAAFLFASGVLITSVMRTTAQTSPSYKITPMVAGESTETASPEQVETKPVVDYYLAYPGILPDHFLYPLKMVRDKVWLFLTRDQVKRAELLLLFADKRLGAAKALIEGGQQELGLSTLTKAEKYLEQAVAQAEKAKSGGKEVGGLYEKLGKASLKHGEVITGFLDKVSDEAKSVVEQTLRYSQEGYKKVAPATPEPEEEPTPTPSEE